MRAPENRGISSGLLGPAEGAATQVVLRKIGVSPEVIGFRRKYLPPLCFACASGAGIADDARSCLDQSGVSLALRVCTISASASLRSLTFAEIRIVAFIHYDVSVELIKSYERSHADTDFECAECERVCALCASIRNPKRINVLFRDFGYRA